MTEAGFRRDGGRRFPARPEKAGAGSRLLVTILCVAAFGPYVVGSIRTEQMAVYALAPLVLLTFINVREWTFGVLAAWALLITASFLGWLFPYSGPAPWPPASVLATMDNLLLPLMVMVAVWSLVPSRDAVDVLRTVATVIPAAAAANALLALGMTVVPEIALQLRPFWGNESVLSTVGERALTMGRHSGVFSQPAEAGLMYSIAAVLVIWAFSKRPAVMYPLLATIALGGVLTVSKIFLLVGIPVAAVALVVTQRGARVRAVVGLVLTAAVVVLSIARLGREWTGAKFLARLLDVPPGQTLIEFYTAGRWDEGSPMLEVIEYIIGASPIVGMGAGGLEVAYDSLWAETMVISGLLGVAAMVAIFVQTLRVFARIRHAEVRAFAIAFWVILLGASFGIPSLTANRVATVVWIIAALLMAIANDVPSRVTRRFDHSTRRLSGGNSVLTSARRHLRTAAAVPARISAPATSASKGGLPPSPA